MIWYVPDIDRSTKTFWYLLFYCLFQTFLSVSLSYQIKFCLKISIIFSFLVNSVVMFLTHLWQCIWHRFKPKETRQQVIVCFTFKLNSKLNIFADLIFLVLLSVVGMAFEVLGVLLAAVIQGVMITIVNPPTCDSTTLAALNQFTSPLISNYSSPTTTTRSFHEETDASTKKNNVTAELVRFSPKIKNQLNY